MKGRYVQAMLQPYDRIRLSLSAANRMKTKCLGHNRTITKCFYFCEKRISNFTTMFCSTILLTIGLLFLRINVIAQDYPTNYLLVEIRKHRTDFSIIVLYYCLLLPTLGKVH